MIVHRHATKLVLTLSLLITAGCGSIGAESKLRLSTGVKSGDIAITLETHDLCLEKTATQ